MSATQCRLRVPPSAQLCPRPTGSPLVAEPTCHGPKQQKSSFVPPFSPTPKLLCSSSTTAHRWLARVLAHRSSILSAQRIPLSSRCFCPQFCSSSPPPPTPMTDLDAAICHPPVRAASMPLTTGGLA
jgi:hypothetical protein